MLNQKYCLFFLFFCIGNTRGDGRIVNGYNAVKGEFPWMINLINNPRTQHLCGGAIISAQWVLTAAHCVEIEGLSISDIILIAGDQTQSDSDSQKQRRNVSEIRIHPNRDIVAIQNKDYDFALLRVNSPFVYNDFVKNVSLPLLTSQRVTGIVTTAGWGLTVGNNNQATPDVLQKGDLTIMPSAECKSLYTGIINITNQMLCVTDPRTSICNGDSGSGLVKITEVPNTNKCKTHVLQGITSFGPTSCSTYPGVFAYVPSTLNWIFNVTGVRGIDSPPYMTCGSDNPPPSGNGTTRLIISLGMILLNITITLKYHFM